MFLCLDLQIMYINLKFYKSVCHTFLSKVIQSQINLGNFFIRMTISCNPSSSLYVGPPD